MHAFMRAVLASLLMLACALAFSNGPYPPIWAGRMIQLAQSAYCSEASIISWSCHSCQLAPKFAPLDTFWNESTTTFGYIGVDSTVTPPLLVVAFRGTVINDLQDWIDNINFPFTTPYRNFPNVEVHRGFYAALLSVKSQVEATLEPLLVKYPTSGLLVNGHSLGAALATLCMSELVLDLDLTGRNLSLFTFGSPRVGNPAYQDLLQGMINSSWRITHWKDIVPHLPWEVFGFHHIAQEVWYNETNSAYTVCNLSGEDPTCADSVAMDAWSVSDHLYYLNVSIGSNDCNGTGMPNFMKR